MANPNHVAVVKQGAEAISKFQNAHGGTQFDLSGADFSGKDLRAANLIRANLYSANFSGANLCGATLIEADVEGANLSGADLSEANLGGANLVDVNFSGVNLSEAVLSEAKLHGADLTRARLSGAKLFAADLTKASLFGADLNNADLNRANLTSANLSGANFTGANLSYADLPSANVTSANLSGANLAGANLCYADLNRANLSYADLHGAKLIETILSQADLSNANLQGATFLGAKLDLAMLLNVVVDASTNFANVASVDRCKISRLTLESLKDYGGLTVGQRVEMDIANHVAKLRQSFSGIRFWVYLGLVLIFFFPYLRFLVWAALRARFVKPAPDEIAVFWSLIYFICSGGREWTRFRPELFPCTNFLFFLTYNLLRASLLWKTKELEMHEEATGLPSPFLFANSPWWNRAYQATKWLLAIAVLAFLWNTWHFMSQTIPIGPPAPIPGP